MATSATSPTAGETGTTTTSGRGSSTAQDPATTGPEVKGKAEVVDDSPTHRIKYNGPSIHTRVIDAEDFKSVGSKQDTLQWDAANRHTVLARLDEAAVDLIKAQPDFKVTKIAEDSGDDDES